MNVTAVFELPVPIYLTCATLGRTYASGYGQVRFDVTLPQDVPPVGVAPVLAGVDLPESQDGEILVWTQEYGAFIPQSLRPATALLRVVINAVEAPPIATMTWAGPDDRLAQVVDSWFDQVRTWAEILTGQDLDPRHRTYDAEVHGAGLTFIEPADVGSSMTITTPRIRPLRAQEWEAVLINVRDGKEPPLEEVLSRDARAAHKRGFTRRAVVDAATAVEVVLARSVVERADELPEAQRARLDRKPMFGTFIDIAEASGIQFEVPFDDLRRLSKSRIEAVHRGKASSSWDTAGLVQVAIDFLGAHGTYQRARDEEPDGSEWVVVSDEANGADRAELAP